MTDPRALNINQGDFYTNTNTSFAIQRDSLRSYSECIVCPYCNKIGFSYTELKCNFISLLGFCLCTKCWFLYNIIAKKDLNCYDADHKCYHCGNHISSYKII